jgi:hypothetical protein
LFTTRDTRSIASSSGGQYAKEEKEEKIMQPEKIHNPVPPSPIVMPGRSAELNLEKELGLFRLFSGLGSQV